MLDLAFGPVKTNIFPFSPLICRGGKKWKLGWLVAEKQPQMVKIPPHMVQKLYCEIYLSIQSMLKKEEEKK